MIIKKGEKIIEINLKPLLVILLLAVGLFVVINFRMVFACITNIVRFFGASAYEKECDVLYDAIDSMQESVRVDRKKYSHVTFQRLCHEFYGGKPEFFYISEMSWKETDSEYILMMKYDCSYEEKEERNKEYQDLLDELAAKVPEAKKCDRIMFLHDYMIKNYSYSSEQHDAYYFLKNGKGACSAYAQVFKAVMDRLGIDCEIVWSTVYNHAWNVVRIGGLWYQIDVTWDDMGDEVSYKYFLATDNGISDRGHGSWENCGKYKIACFSPIYDIKYSKLK